MSLNAATKVGIAGLGALTLATGYGSHRIISSYEGDRKRELEDNLKPYQELATKLHTEFPKVDASNEREYDQFIEEHKKDVRSMSSSWDMDLPHRVVVDTERLTGKNGPGLHWLLGGAGVATLFATGSFVNSAYIAGQSSRIGAAGPLVATAIGVGLLGGALAGMFTSTPKHLVVYPSGETREASSKSEGYEYSIRYPEPEDVFTKTPRRLK